MISASVTAARRHPGREAVWLLAALALAAIGRALLNGQTPASAFAAGTAFGLVLLALAFGAGWRPGRVALRPMAIGVLGGLVLVAIPRLFHLGLPALIGMRPEPFVIWAAVTTLVSVAEEVLLRGALFDAVDTTAGTLAAIVLTSAAFALMHVPLYGWQIVPLDFGVGLWLAGLRMASGGVTAPAIAHLLADLSTWAS